MKKILTSMALVLLGVGMQAQQNVHLQAPVKSPEVNGDTVIFHIYAPGHENITVEGAFSNVLPELVTENDGTFYFKFIDVAPELYDYWFEVDGVRTLDPSNPYVARDIASLANIFIVPGGNADWFESRDVPHGTVSKMWYESEILGGNRRMTIYTPPGYEDNLDKSYPVLYLLHGMGGDEDAWSELGRAIQILDNQIEAGVTEPMIVVMPNGNALRKSAPGFTADGMYIAEGQHSVDPEKIFVKSFPEIIDFVERHYRVRTDKGSRAVAGLSMGGGHAWQLGLAYPDTFDYIGLFSPAVRWNGAGVDETDDPTLDAMLDRQFQNPPRKYQIAIGRDDFLYGINESYRNLLDSKQLPYEYIESEGGHTWRNWRNYLVDFLPTLFR